MDLRNFFCVAENLGLGYGEDRVEEGWINLFNGYKYRTAGVNSTWSDSQSACLGFGGHLAQFGIRDVGTRL